MLQMNLNLGGKTSNRLNEQLMIAPVFSVLSHWLNLVKRLKAKGDQCVALGGQVRILRGVESVAGTHETQDFGGRAYHLSSFEVVESWQGGALMVLAKLINFFFVVEKDHVYGFLCLFKE